MFAVPGNQPATCFSQDFQNCCVLGDCSVRWWVKYAALFVGRRSHYAGSLGSLFKSCCLTALAVLSPHPEVSSVGVSSQ